MSYKLIAVDIDDTLVNREKKITPKTKSALISVQKKGVRVAIASGRFPKGVIPLADELELRRFGGYRISYNGGAVFRASGEEVSRCYLDRKYIKPLYEIINKTDTMVVFHKDDAMFADSKLNAYSDKPSFSNNGNPLNRVDDLLSFVTFDIPKLVLVNEHETLEKLRKTIAARYGNELNICYSAPFFLEIMPKQVDKGLGLKAVCDDMGISLSEAIAFGDNFNDLAMLRAAGLGIAMGNAPEEIKAESDMVTLDCDSDGIAAALNKLYQI